jgi:hypothetical protein
MDSKSRGGVAKGELLRLNNFKIQQPKSWQDVAQRLERETDPDRICALSRELIALIDTQTGRTPKKVPHIVKLGKTSAKSNDC